MYYYNVEPITVNVVKSVASIYLSIQLQSRYSDCSNIPRLFPSFKEGQSCLGHINHFYRIDDRDDELSRSSDSIIESGSSKSLHCTENLAVSVSSWKRTRVVYTADCHANNLALTASCSNPGNICRNQVLHQSKKFVKVTVFSKLLLTDSIGQKSFQRNICSHF